MSFRNVVRSYTFRFISIYVAVLSGVVFTVLGGVYVAFSYDYFNDVHESIYHELNNLESAWSRGGVAGVEVMVRAQARSGTLKRFSYLVVDEDHRKLAGNLDSWPKYKEFGDGWLSFELDMLQWDGRAVDIDLVARSKALPDGTILLAARHYNDVLDKAELVASTLVQSLLVTIVLGTIGGAITSWLTLRRLDGINLSIQRILSGDLSERLPDRENQGDFQRLIINLNAMLDRIQQLMEGLRQVSDNIAHDLRTPLTRLRNRAVELESSLTGDTQEQAQSLIEEADGLLATFSALLRIAKVESGERRQAFRDLDLSSLLKDVAELYEPLAQDQDITVVETVADGVWVHGDRDLLFQAFANLVDNAIKYSPDGGTIRIHLHRQEQQVCVEISDTGIGIEPSERDKVFRRFFRVESSRSQIPGNGLGLSLVAAVIQLHDGSIGLDGVSPQGLMVRVHLPALVTPAA